MGTINRSLRRLRRLWRYWVNMEKFIIQTRVICILFVGFSPCVARTDAQTLAMSNDARPFPQCTFYLYISSKRLHALLHRKEANAQTPLMSSIKSLAIIDNRECYSIISHS